MSKSQNYINDNKFDYFELPTIYKLRKIDDTLPIIPFKYKNNSLIKDNIIKKICQ